MKGWIGLFWGAFIIILSAYSANYVSPLGIMIMTLGFLALVGFVFYNESMIGLIAFYSICLLVSSYAIIQEGLSSWIGIITSMAVLGIIIVFGHKSKERAIKEEPMISKEEVMEKEMPFEEEPKVVITDIPHNEKFFASRTGKVYHGIHCGFSDRITEKRWFSSKKEAEDSGLTPHSCVKNAKFH